MRKRMLSWGLILFLLLTMLPVSAMAAESGEHEAEPAAVEIPDLSGTKLIYNGQEQTNDWAQPAMIWAVEQGLIAGAGHDRMEPRGQATRAQEATILMRFDKDMAQ